MLKFQVLDFRRRLHSIYHYVTEYKPDRRLV